MFRPYLVDTDVFIDYLRGFSEAVAFVKGNSTRIITSSIVVAELYAGVKGEEEEETLESLISLFRVIPVSPELAKQGGFYRRDYGKSHSVGLADAIIAATATGRDAELKTLNTRHYPMFKGLKPAYRKT